MLSLRKFVSSLNVLKVSSNIWNIIFTTTVTTIKTNSSAAAAAAAALSFTNSSYNYRFFLLLFHAL
jgi:hypothetical protein